MNRSWDIELCDNPETIKEKLAEGPVLCQVLNKDIRHDTLFRLANDFYLFGTRVLGEERIVVLPGACRSEESMRDSESVKYAFGKDVSDYQDIELFGDVIHVGGVPYLPFLLDADPNVVGAMRGVFDVQDVEGHVAILCTYFDARVDEGLEGKVVSQQQAGCGDR